MSDDHMSTQASSCMLLEYFKVTYVDMSQYNICICVYIQRF